MGLIIPCYMDPTQWGQVAAAKRQFPTVPVICIAGDTASGSGAAPRTDITAAIADLEGAGCSVIGYVATGYGGRTLADAMADSDRWFSFYPVRGIFWDEVGSSPSYYLALSQHIWGRGATTSVGNPGTSSSIGSSFDF